MINSSDKRPIVAAFDFDGTITTRDSLLPFLLYASGKWKTFSKLLFLSPALLGYSLNLLSRQEAKERTLKNFFSGKPLKELQATAKAFAHSETLKRLIKKSALERLQWHKNQHHRCILVSASIDLYLEPWTQLMGFDDLLCSNVEIINDQTISGRLSGLNCRGEEKIRRLETLLGPKDSYILYAYGDSSGDKELLQLADYPFYRVF